MPEENEATSRECPLCGGTMSRKTSETVVHVPGNPAGTKREATEWVCPDCDYFEEADQES